MTELNTLKRKSPADLWKEDLAAFSEELEVSAYTRSTFLHLAEPLVTFQASNLFLSDDIPIFLLHVNRALRPRRRRTPPPYLSKRGAEKAKW